MTPHVTVGGGAPDVRAADHTECTEEIARLRAEVALLREQLRARGERASSEPAEESRRILDAMMDSFPQGITITGGPPDFPVLRVSRYGWAMAGGVRPGLMGLSAGHHQAAWRIVLPDGGTPLPEQMPLYRASRFGEEIRNAEFALLQPDGTAVPVLVDAVPIRDAEGNIVGALNCWRDISDRERIQEALRESEARFRSVLDNSRDVIYRVDLRTGRCEYMTPSVASLVGYSASELVAMSAEEALLLIHPDDVSVLRDAIARLEDAGITEAEYRQRAKSGEYKWLSNRMSLVRDDAGRPLFRDGSIRDITERKEAEAELRESEARFRTMADGSLVMIWLSDASRGIWFANRAFREFHGIALDDVAGTGWEPCVHPEDAASYARTVDVSMRTGQPFDIEARVKRADGAWRWVRTHGEPRWSHGGELLGHVVTSFDITEQRRAEHERERLLVEVRRSEQELETVFKALPYLVSIHDKDGRYLRVNPAVTELFGVDPVHEMREDIARRLNARFADGEPLTPANMPSSRALRGEACFNTEYVVTDRHGRDRVLLINAIPIFSGAQVSGAVFAQMDITERREAEEQLRQANELLREADRQKSEFLAVLSHELRNPLAPIKNGLYVLDHTAPGSEQAVSAKAMIARQVNQLARLVDDLLDATRLTRGKLRLEKRRVDLVDIARRTAEDHRALCEKAGLALDVRTAGGPMWIDGDEARLAQVVGNLLNNAAKFTPAGGAVSITVESEGARVAVVRVRDTGVGIGDEMMDRLFEPFAQADRSLDRSKGGLGLGLSLVKGIVEMHGGSVSAGSDGPGAGAEFVVRLPVEVEEVAVPLTPTHLEARLEACEPSAARPRPRPRPRPRRVLVIDDNADAADSLRDLLEFGGHQVEVAYDGPQGVERARTMKPDVVLCDIGLPGFDGYAVARALRGGRALPDSTRLVALTGYARPDDVEQAKNAGFDDHIAKPPTWERIEQILRNAPASS